MVSGRDPGELGIYGFRRREPGSYALGLHDAGSLEVPRVWDLLGAAGFRVSALFVPPSYPPSKVSGEMVGCFLTPDAEAPHSYPATLKGELAAHFGPYVPDVAHLGATADLALLEQLEAMTAQHFAMAKHVWTTREPDFEMFVCIGPDRFHHAFYRHVDPNHPEYIVDPALGDVGRRFYAFLDRQIGELLREMGDDTTVMVVSDHGARPLEGAFRINNWLRQRGQLHLRSEPGPNEAIIDHVDWSRTRAWAEGGYYARVFLNVRGREASGIVPEASYEAERAELREALLGVRGPFGQAWQNHVETPEALYREVRGGAPDLLAVFDDLRVRPLATLGGGALHAPGDDRGNDACNHDWNGIFVLAGANVGRPRAVASAEIYDVGATLLSLFEVPRPPGFKGRDLRELT